MREVDVQQVTDAVRELSISANYHLPTDVLSAMKDAAEKEISPVGKDVLKMLVENARTASEEEIPICQDTGTTVVFIDVGQYVHFVGGDLHKAINCGVAEGYEHGYLRKSMTVDPFVRDNTGDNTPAIIHSRITAGDAVRICVMPKGGGSENMSVARGLTPADGEEGVRDFVVRTVEKAGANPCPPIIIGVGVGGTIEQTMLSAKRALTRSVGKPHPEKHIAELEEAILEKVNDLGIGPQGLGGRTTALAVHIETTASHIASLMTAVNIGCHASRHAEKII